MVDRDRDILAERLARLEKLVEKLARQSEIALDRFIRDADQQDLAERRLQLAAQVCIDIAHYLLARDAEPVAERGQDPFVRLAHAEVIQAALAERMQGLVGFRNILVHDYLKIDPATVYEHLTGRLDDFRDFAKAVVRHAGMSDG